jgi:hypothetical protein
VYSYEDKRFYKTRSSERTRLARHGLDRVSARFGKLLLERLPDPSPPNGSDLAPLVFHLHLPKTGGSTLNSILVAQYGRNRFLSYSGLVEQSDIEQFQATPPETLYRYDAMRAHTFFGIHEGMTRPFTYITIIRDPIDRLISTYYYILQSKGHPDHRYYVDKKVSFEQFIEARPKNQMQVQRLSGGPKLKGLNPDDRLRVAKTNLRESFAVVGVTERFDESLICMKNKFGWGLPVYRRKNETRDRPSRDEIRPALLELMLERSRLDTELHRFANQLLDEQIAAAGPAFAGDLAALRRENALKRAVGR